MARTNYAKQEFGCKAYAHVKGGRHQSTREYIVKSQNAIKIVHKEEQGGVLSGCKKVNFADEKVKSAYRRINKMLGGI